MKNGSRGRGRIRRFQRIGPEQRVLLDDIEAAIMSIRHPIDIAAAFHAQVLYAIQRAGLSITREVALEDGRRVDCVVVDRRGTVVLELEDQQPSRATLVKFLDLPRDVLRMCVFRCRQSATRRIVGCDRIVCRQADLRMVPWLHDGDALLIEEDGSDPGRKAVTGSMRKSDDSLFTGLLRGARFVNDGVPVVPTRGRRAKRTA